MVCVCFIFPFLLHAVPRTGTSLPVRGRCRRARYPPLGKPFVSAALRRLFERIRLSRRAFRSCPLPGPVAVPQHLVAGMDGEFDEHRPHGDAEHLGTDVDDAPAQFETSVERTAT